MEMNFCRRCGEALAHKTGKVYQCANAHTIFASPTPSTGIFFLTADNKVVLSVRGIEPHKGMLDAFGGFLDDEETLETAAMRELTEELGLHEGDYEPLNYLTSAVGHYPYQGETPQVITALYWTRLGKDVQLNPQDDVAAVEVVPLHNVDMDMVHDEDIRVGIRTLQHLFPKEAK